MKLSRRGLFGLFAKVGLVAPVAAAAMKEAAAERFDGVEPMPDSEETWVTANYATATFTYDATATVVDSMPLMRTKQ